MTGQMSDRAVLKLGGSLLDLPDWPVRLNACIEQIPQPVVVVGGGRAADQVRNWQQDLGAGDFGAGICGLDDLQAHQLALEAMRFNAIAVASVLSGRLVSTFSDVESCWGEATIPVVDAVQLLSVADPDQQWIPACWDATSDAISAFVAGHWQFKRLILLKSVSLPVSMGLDSSILETAVEHQMVDPLIGRLAGHFSLSVEWKNLRADLV